MSTSNTIKTFGKSQTLTDSQAVANETIDPIQVDQVLLDEVKSYLSTKNFKDDDSLEIMALIIADIHKKSEIPLDQLIGDIDSNDVATLTNKALSHRRASNVALVPLMAISSNPLASISFIVLPS